MTFWLSISNVHCIWRCWLVFNKNTNHKDNTAMSSMAPVYRGEVFGKQIYTMHSTIVYTHPYTDINQQVCDKEYLKTKV